MYLQKFNTLSTNTLALPHVTVIYPSKDPGNNNGGGIVLDHTSPETIAHFTDVRNILDHRFTMGCDFSDVIGDLCPCGCGREGDNHE